jgi:orotate phosphoribosyltransferase-like protein
VKGVRDWYTVKNMHNKGVPIKPIARELNMSKNTVKSLIKKEDEPRYSRSVSKTSIDHYKDKI